MQRGKTSFVLIVLLVTSFFGGVDAKAAPGKVDYWNWSFSEDTGEKVDVTEKSTSSNYLRGPVKKLRMYGWGPTIGNPNEHEISPIGIEPNKAYILEFRLEAHDTMPNNKDNAIDIAYETSLRNGTYTPFDTNKRNFFMRQHPNSPRAGTAEEDANVYDLRIITRSHFIT